jgi:hypothetical protein
MKFTNQETSLKIAALVCGASLIVGCALQRLEVLDFPAPSAPSASSTVNDVLPATPEPQPETADSHVEQDVPESPFAGLSGPPLWARWNAANGDAYELDGLERFIEGNAKRVECQSDVMVPYAGTSVRYFGQVLINPPFRERLVRFEEVVAEVATEIYGRAPHRIRHLGAYSCRRSRTRTYRLSEHALGNAIDVLGFDFAGTVKNQTFPPDLPRQLRGPFQVRVARHWNADTPPIASLHAQFLRRLTERLLDRSDIFRIALGPSHRGHQDHFHFDMSPWRYVHL